MASKSQPRLLTTSARKYGASCLSCRHRKVRCDAAKPICNPCLRSNLPCHYPPADPVVTRLSRSLETAQVRIRKLEQALQVAQGRSGSSHASVETPYASPCDSLREQVSVNECGKIEQYGATSRFHSVHALDDASPSSATTGAVDAGRRRDSAIDVSYHKKWLRSNARFQQAWESAAHAKLATMDSDVDGDVASTLMNIYWTWQAPLHQCIYRRCFFRDLALDGPYFSPFLLNVIYAHACRHAKPGDVRLERFERGEYFLRKAKLLLVDMFSQKPQITTIQGLLILGGRQCAVGRISEGWLYTGMAIRMMKDIGLHLAPTQDMHLSELEPDDLEVRRRLFLSAYAWDKTISLCLGRFPSLVEMPYPPHCIMDDFGDSEPWVPFYLDLIEDGHPPPPGYTELTFSYFVELCKIVQKIYYHVYGPRSSLPGYSLFKSLEDELRTFYASLPATIRVDDIGSQLRCPPPHIFSLNILYHDLLILLYRPLAFSLRHNREAASEDARSCLMDHAKAVCREEASVVNAFVKAYGKTYRFQFQTYLTSYCVYTAATIEILLVADTDPEVADGAVERLQTMLQMLEAEVQQTPGIRHSRDIIRARLVELGLPIADSLYQQRRRPEHVYDGMQLAMDSTAVRKQVSSQDDPYANANCLPPSTTDCIYWLDSFIMETGAGFLDPSVDNSSWGNLS